MSHEFVERFQRPVGSASDRIVSPVDPMMGGQFGFMPNFRDTASSTLYARKPMISIMLAYPLFLDYLPGDAGRLLKEQFKVIHEEHPLSIEGINLTKTPDYQKAAHGGGGQQLSHLTNIMSTESSPSFSFQERAGKLYTTFYDFWFRVGGMNHETKISELVHMVDRSQLPDLPLENFFSMAMMHIETNPFGTKVIEAAITHNMMPASGVPREMTRNLPEGDTVLQFSMEYTSVTEDNAAVRDIAQEWLDSVSLFGVSPNNRQAAFDSVHPDLLTGSSRGWRESIAERARTQRGLQTA